MFGLYRRSMYDLLQSAIIWYNMILKMQYLFLMPTIYTVVLCNINCDLLVTLGCRSSWVSQILKSCKRCNFVAVIAWLSGSSHSSAITVSQMSRHSIGPEEKFWGMIPDYERRQICDKCPHIPSWERLIKILLIFGMLCLVRHTCSLHHGNQNGRGRTFGAPSTFVFRPSVHHVWHDPAKVGSNY